MLREWKKESSDGKKLKQPLKEAHTTGDGQRESQSPGLEEPGPSTCPASPGYEGKEWQRGSGPGWSQLSVLPGCLLCVQLVSLGELCSGGCKVTALG